jgi:hypothetical protein
VYKRQVRNKTKNRWFQKKDKENKNKENKNKENENKENENKDKKTTLIKIYKIQNTKYNTIYKIELAISRFTV